MTSVVIILNGETHAKTVRNCKCEVLVGNGKCSLCVRYHNTLQKVYNCWLKQQSLSPSRWQSAWSRTNFTHLNAPEKQKQYSNLRVQLKTNEKQIERMKDKIEYLTKLNGVSLGQEMQCDDLKSIMTDI